MAESLRHKTLKGTLWSSLERFSVQGIAFAVMIIMARILTPEDYGLVGMLTVFIAISQSFIDSGFSQALIRKQDRSEIDNSTVFYFNIVIGILIYLILFLSAPFISNFYNEPKLTSITRVIGLNVIFNSLVIVQRALLTINLDFKTQAKASLIAVIISGTIGIAMAYTGFGVWSIVVQQLMNLFIVSCLLWIFSKWRPKNVFSWTSFKELFGFGSKLLVSGLLDTLYKNGYLIVIGKIFKSSDLGYYTRAQQFTDFASSNVTGILQRVTYPVLCTIQDDDERLAEIYRRLLRVSTYIIFPLMIGIVAVAKPMVLTLLNEKWSFTVVLIQILCLAQMWYPVHAINLNLLQVKGRSDIFLKLDVIKKIVGVVILCITIPFGLIVMSWGLVLSSLISLVINTIYTGKLIKVGFFTQMRDVFPICLLSFLMGTTVYGTITSLNLIPWIKLLIGVFEGIFIYIFLSIIFHFKEFSEIKLLLKHK